MTVWPFLPVWPFLIGLAVFFGIWNWRAGVSFVACVLLVRGIIYFELNNQVLWLMVLYSVMAFVVMFFVDKVAGGFFAIVSVLMGLFLLGFMAHRTEMIASEIALVLGMIASAVFGPTGGLYNPIRGDRPSSVDAMAPQHIAQTRQDHQGGG